MKASGKSDDGVRVTPTGGVGETVAGRRLENAERGLRTDQPEAGSPKGMTVAGGSLLWFGAAVSLAEIMTGTLLAPMGFWPGMAAIVLGHLAGGLLLFLVGLIGAQSGKTAMETTGVAFGRPGTVFFASLNVVQLMGWTAVMIAGGGAALAPFIGLPYAACCAIIGGLIIVWAAVGLGRLGRLNAIAVGGLLGLSLLLAFIVFRSGQAPAPSSETMRFGVGLELAIAMPVSWLPLMADYTRSGKKPVRLTAASTVAYSAGSVLMYAIGLGAALFAGNPDVTAILAAAGLGVAAVVIVVLATVTTTFLDVFSAGESAKAVFPKLNTRWTAIGVALIGTLAAIVLTLSAYEQFLYFIGSVFAPMAAVQIADWFVRGNRQGTANPERYVMPRQGTANGGRNAITRKGGEMRGGTGRAKGDHITGFINLAVWAVGFVAYRWLLSVETPVGNTLPVLALTFCLCLAAHGIRGLVNGTRVAAHENHEAKS